MWMLREEVHTAFLKWRTKWKSDVAVANVHAHRPANGTAGHARDHDDAKGQKIHTIHTIHNRHTRHTHPPFPTTHTPPTTHTTATTSTTVYAVDADSVDGHVPSSTTTSQLGNIKIYSGTGQVQSVHTTYLLSETVFH